jgi:hypothetical protein
MRGAVTIKDLVSGDQFDVPIGDVAVALRERLEAGES